MLDQSKVAETYLTARPRVRRMFLRPIIDAAAVFALLSLTGLACSSGPSKAGPHIPPTISAMAMPPAVQKAIGPSDFRPVVEIATTSSPSNPDAVYRRTSIHAAWTLLMLSLSVIVALNLALYRHMRTAYTPRIRRAEDRNQAE